MKKILMAAVAALAITSCTQEEEIGVQDQRAEIKVGTVVKKAPRAGVTDNTNFDKFTLYSYVTADQYVAGTALGTPYMNGVAYTKPSGSWSNTGTYYWPAASEAKAVQFYAYPTEMANNYKVSAANYPTIDFTVAATSAAQKDLVVASAANKKIGDASGGQLTLDFKHVLARINFAYKVADAGFDYAVSAVTVKDIKGSAGTYSFEGKWDLTGATTADYTYPITQSTTKVATKDYYMLGDASASLMLFPQDVAGKKIEITYKATPTGQTWAVFSGTVTVTLPAGATWTIGQNILYVLTLSSNGEAVGITPNVGGWDSEEEPTTPAPIK